MGTDSSLEPRIESPREESGEDAEVAASKDVGGAEKSCVAAGGRLICMPDIPSLSVAASTAVRKLNSLNVLGSVSTGGFLVTGAKDLVARGASTSSQIKGLALNSGTFLGAGCGGCLKFFVDFCDDSCVLLRERCEALLSLGDVCVDGASHDPRLFDASGFALNLSTTRGQQVSFSKGRCAKILYPYLPGFEYLHPCKQVLLSYPLYEALSWGFQASWPSSCVCSYCHSFA